MVHLSAEVQTLHEVNQNTRSDMYTLYSQHYDATDREQFNQDLDSKTHVVLMHDPAGALQGFTSLARFWHNHQGTSCQVVYSGDTIIHQDFWGEQTLPESWIKLTGQFKREHPDLPLYWFLIVKGHRTYRYLSIFSKDYYPCYDKPTPDEMQSLINALAGARFGDFYHTDSGLIQFPQSRGHLKTALGEIPDNAMKRVEVQYFLQRNPGYASGDELACVTELSVENLTRRARIYFEKGLQAC